MTSLNCSSFVDGFNIPSNLQYQFVATREADKKIALVIRLTRWVRRGFSDCVQHLHVTDVVYVK